MFITMLRQLKYLTVINVDLDRVNQFQEGVLAVWKREFIDLLKDSPSPDRGVLGWKVVQSRPIAIGFTYDVVESEELEVTQRTPL